MCKHSLLLTGCSSLASPTATTQPCILSYACNAMLCFKQEKYKLANEVDPQIPAFPPERTSYHSPSRIKPIQRASFFYPPLPTTTVVFAPSSSASSTWSPEPSTPYLGSHTSGSASPYSPTASLGALPPDALHLGPHAYKTPTHVPSNASSYDAYARQRHDSPQPLLETVYEDLRSGHMTDVRVSRHVFFQKLLFLYPWIASSESLISTYVCL
jgi:hypothetical protein